MPAMNRNKLAFPIVVLLKVGGEVLKLLMWLQAFSPRPLRTYIAFGESFLNNFICVFWSN